MARHPSRSLIAVRRRRRPKPVKFRLQTPKWFDPYPWIPGTEPEKRVFAALVNNGIYFRFQDNFEKDELALQVTADIPQFKPDFIVPEWKIIFDPFGDYHHSKAFAGSAALNKLNESDVRKFFYYEKLGYEFIHPWSSEVIRYGGEWVLRQSKRLGGPPLFKLSPEDVKRKAAMGFYLGPNLGLGSTSVGIANKKRAKRGSPLLRPAR
jgi:hypothetical protein